MNTNYLVVAANEIFRLVVLNSEPSTEDLSDAAHAGCETLGVLLGDAEFFADVEELARRKVEGREEFDYITADLTYFVNYFLKIERKILLAGGVEPQLIDHLFESAKEALKVIRIWDGDTQTLRWLIEHLQEEVCQFKLRLEEEQDEKEWREAWKRRLKRVTLAIGGAAMVGLDVSALALAYGLTAPGSAVSLAVGSALIGAAVPAGAVVAVGA